MDVTQNIGEWFPLDLTLIATGIGVEGLAYNAVGLEISYQKPGGAVVVFSPTAAQWREGHEGTYQVFFPNAVVDTAGMFLWWGKYTGCLTYKGAVEIAATAAAPAPSPTNASFRAGIRSRGIAETDISNDDLDTLMAEALITYGQYYPVISTQVFETVAYQQAYTWTAIGDADGLMALLVVWNPNEQGDMWTLSRTLESMGVPREGAYFHLPSQSELDALKELAWARHFQGTGHQLDLDGGSLYLDPLPTQAGDEVWVLFTKAVAALTGIPSGNRQAFLDLVESMISSRLANQTANTAAATVVQTPEYRIETTEKIRYWRKNGRDLMQSFIEGSQAGHSAASRS